MSEVPLARCRKKIACYMSNGADQVENCCVKQPEQVLRSYMADGVERLGEAKLAQISRLTEPATFSPQTAIDLPLA